MEPNQHAYYYYYCYCVNLCTEYTYLVCIGIVRYKTASVVRLLINAEDIRPTAGPPFLRISVR